MNNEERYNSQALSAHRDMLKITIISVVFLLCSAAIFATKYKTDIIDLFTVESADNNVDKAAVSTPDDAYAAEDDKEAQEQTAAKEQTTTEEITATEEQTTEDDTTEEQTTEEITTNYLDYVNAENPDISSKGDDWYNEDLFAPANVTDDAYFDTAVVIGDSRTEGLSLYTGLSNLDAFYSKGLNIEKVMTDKVVETEDGTVTVLEALELKDYDNIYISFGLNELGWAFDSIFIEDYKIFIDAVKEVEPDAVIYVQSILPVSKELSDEDEIYNNPRIEEYNELLKEMCQEYTDVIYLDAASSVSVDGALPADASTDGRHCNKEYCLKWLDYIRNNIYVKK